MDRTKVLILMLILCCGSLMGGVFLFSTAKSAGDIEGTREFYIKKYELEKLKKDMIKAVANDAKILPPEKTLADFNMDFDAYTNYKIEYSAGKQKREETIARSTPLLEPLKLWCAKHKDGYETFKKSNTKITGLDGSQITAATFDREYFTDVSEEGKKLLKQICEE